MISVIVPYHKGEAFLKDCLSSLKDQTYRDIEVLLICDHVREEELGFLTDYEVDFPIRVYHLKDKTGVAAARNLGLDMARGEYVYFLDSDDYLYDTTLENLVNAVAEMDDDIVYGKKKPTWFQRSIFLARKEQQDSEDVEEEDENSEGENAELNMENGGEAGKGSSDDSSDGKEDGSEDDSHSESDAEKGEGSEDEADETEEMLTEEELLLRQQARVRRAYRILVTKRKGVRNISVLNILFKRSFIEEHGLRFPEELKYFSDVPFLLEALSKTEKIKKRLSAKYVKRKHNDAINLPALSQIKDPNRFDEFVQVYYETIRRIPKDSELRRRLDKKYINYYSKTFAPRLKRSSNEKWRNEYFVMMSELMSGMDRDLIRSLKGYQKRVIKALIRRDLQKSLRIVKTHLGYKKLKTIIRHRKALAMTLYIHVFLKKEVKTNWIMFESFFGKNYSDSPKYIYEYISKNYPGKYRCIWVIDNKKSKIPYKHKRIKRFSFRYYYYLARCGYFVFNSRQPEWAVKRPESIFLETWHGTPLKKLVFDIEDITSASPKYKQQVYKQSRAWDYLIAPNAFSSETFRRCFMYENAMLETGYPRNDILHAPDRDKLALEIRCKLGIPANKKTILYAPTWRDDEYYGKGQYKFELHMDLNLMKKELGDEYVLLLRTHYFIADSLDVSGVEDFAINLSKYDDISELYLISDILITDYSSVFFDYANLKRPMLFFTYDLEKYRDVLRGFYIDIEKEVPGPLLFTTEEVVDAVKNIASIQKEYADRYETFYHRFCEWEDGHASQKVVESVFIK
jgi:CDP-glycerol glycerophosphotransferase